MNILIPPIVNMPRVCDECPEDLCLIGYTPPCPSQCYDFDFTCEPIYNSYECSGTFTMSWHNYMSKGIVILLGILSIGLQCSCFLWYWLVIKMFCFLMSKIKEVRREAIAYLSITLFLWLIGILTPYISGLYIDFLITEISFKLLIWFVVVIAVIGSLQMFCRYFMSVASTKFNQKLVASISSNIYQKIFNSRYSEYTNVDNAYYIDQINKDTSTLVTFSLPTY